MREGTTVTLHNAEINMYKGTMRLVLGNSGRIEVAEPASFEVNQDNNLSVIEYEEICVSV
ncbi:hypothetical protein PTKIN_Ptkin15bG0150600 [Pterospermum kingtungense]